MVCSRKLLLCLSFMASVAAASQNELCEVKVNPKPAGTEANENHLFGRALSFAAKERLFLKKTEDEPAFREVLEAVASGEKDYLSPEIEAWKTRLMQTAASSPVTQRMTYELGRLHGLASTPGPELAHGQIREAPRKRYRWFGTLTIPIIPFFSAAQFVEELSAVPGGTRRLVALVRSLKNFKTLAHHELFKILPLFDEGILRSAAYKALQGFVFTDASFYGVDDFIQKFQRLFPNNSPLKLEHFTKAQHLELFRRYPDLMVSYSQNEPLELSSAELVFILKSPDLIKAGALQAQVSTDEAQKAIATLGPSLSVDGIQFLLRSAAKKATKLSILAALKGSPFDLTALKTEVDALPALVPHQVVDTAEKISDGDERDRHVARYGRAYLEVLSADGMITLHKVMYDDDVADRLLWDFFIVHRFKLPHTEVVRLAGALHADDLANAMLETFYELNHEKWDTATPVLALAEAMKDDEKVDQMLLDFAKSKPTLGADSLDQLADATKDPDEAGAEIRQLKLRWTR